MKNTEDMKFWIFIIHVLFSKKHFLNSQYEYANEWVDKFVKISFFFVLKLCKSIFPYQITAKTILHLFRVYIRQVLLSHSWNMGFSSLLWTKYVENKLSGDEIINSLICSSIDCSRKCFNENYVNSKVHIFLIFFTDLHQICLLFCSKCFTLSIDLT